MSRAEIQPHKQEETLKEVIDNLINNLPDNEFDIIKKAFREFVALENPTVEQEVEVIDFVIALQARTVTKRQQTSYIDRLREPYQALGKLLSLVKRYSSALQTFRNKESNFASLLTQRDIWPVIFRYLKFCDVQALAFSCKMLHDYLTNESNYNYLVRGLQRARRVTCDPKVLGASLQVSLFSQRFAYRKARVFRVANPYNPNKIDVEIPLAVTQFNKHVIELPNNNQFLVVDNLARLYNEEGEFVSAHPLLLPPQEAGILLPPACVGLYQGQYLLTSYGLRVNDRCSPVWEKALGYRHVFQNPNDIFNYMGSIYFWDISKQFKLVAQAELPRNIVDVIVNDKGICALVRAQDDSTELVTIKTTESNGELISAEMDETIGLSGLSYDEMFWSTGLNDRWLFEAYFDSTYQSSRWVAFSFRELDHVDFHVRAIIRLPRQGVQSKECIQLASKCFAIRYGKVIRIYSPDFKPLYRIDGAFSVFSERPEISSLPDGGIMAGSIRATTGGASIVMYPGALFSQTYKRYTNEARVVAYDEETKETHHIQRFN